MTNASFLTLEGAKAGPVLFIRTTSCFKADVHKQLTHFTAGLLTTVVHNRTDPHTLLPHSTAQNLR